MDRSSSTLEGPERAGMTAHALDLKRSSAPGLINPERPSAVVVRLVRGMSHRNVWLFRSTDLGASVSIGAGNCDWPLMTGGYEISELTLLFAGNTLLARRERPGNRVRLDGEPLGDDWTFVGHGSRIEVGLACLEFQFTTDHAGLPPLASNMRLPRASESGERSIAATTPHVARAREEAPPAQEKPPRAVASERVDLVLRSGVAMARVSASGSQPSQRKRPAVERRRKHAMEISKQSLEARRPPEAWVQACVPAPSAGPRKGLTITGFAFGLVLLAALYAGWLMLLEST
jgi:hypothetical protein